MSKQTHNPVLPDESVNPFTAYDRMALSRAGFNALSGLIGIEAPDLSELHHSIRTIGNKGDNADRKAHKKIANGLRKIFLDRLQEESCVIGNDQYHDLTAALVIAWVGAEHPVTLFATLSRKRFTHGQRLHDARVDTGCIAQPLVAMSTPLMPSQINPNNRLAVVCQELARGAFDWSPVAALSGVFAPLVAIIRISDDDGVIRAEMLQSMIRNSMKDPQFQKKHPEAHALCLDIMATCTDDNAGTPHRFDKIILSPEPNPRGFVLANAIYQPALKKLAMMEVGEKLARHLDAELDARIAERIEKGTPNSKLPKRPGAFSAVGNLAPHSVNNAVNGGHTLNMMAGRYQTPVVTPPPQFSRLVAAQESALAKKIAKELSALITQPEIEMQEEDAKAALRSSGSILLRETQRHLLDAMMEHLVALAHGYNTTFSDMEFNAKQREKLEEAGREFYEEVNSNISGFLRDGFVKIVAKVLQTDGSAGANQNLEQVTEALAGAINAVMVFEVFKKGFDRLLGFRKQSSAKSIGGEHLEYLNAGFKRAALKRKPASAPTTASESTSTIQLGIGAAAGGFRAGCRYTQGQTTALSIRFTAKNCTLYGGLTAGLPSLTAQHGLAYKALTVNRGIDFTDSLLVLHDVTPHFERHWNRVLVTAYRDKKIQDAWSVSAESKQARPFLQAGEKPNSKEPLQSTFTGDVEASLVIRLNEITNLGQEQLNEILNSFQASRFSGGIISEVRVTNIISGSENTDSHFHSSNWLIPQGYVMTEIEAGDLDNMMQRMMAHNMMYRGRRVSELLPELSVPGVTGAFGYTMAGAIPITEQTATVNRNGSNITCQFAEPVFFPVELTHIRRLNGRGLNDSGIPWIMFDEAGSRETNGYLLAQTTQ